METVVLLSVFIGIGIAGGIITKKLDAFLMKNRELIEKDREDAKENAWTEKKEASTGEENGREASKPGAAAADGKQRGI